MIQKSEVRAAIIQALGQDFENFVATSRRTRVTGNDAQTKAEGKYDTRSIEENYLADGLAKHALVAKQAAEAISALPLTTAGVHDPIALGTLVELAFPNENLWFFLAPAAGGLEVTVAGRTITILTPESPLARQLLGLHLGESTTQPRAKILQTF